VINAVWISISDPVEFFGNSVRSGSGSELQNLVGSQSGNRTMFNTSRQATQKICANLDNHWSKKCLFLCVQTNWVCPSGTQRFYKYDSSLESFTVTRVESSHYFFQRDSSRVRVTKNRDSNRVIDSSHAITACDKDDIQKVFRI